MSDTIQFLDGSEAEIKDGIIVMEMDSYDGEEYDGSDLANQMEQSLDKFGVSREANEKTLRKMRLEEKHYRSDEIEDGFKTSQELA